ncbi:MAG: cyclase family protein [Spirochaetaceae bacterium]|jgi:arylformamidase|nr:cyclase family protein [Spirochaetaceae bacterium]
MAIIDITRVVQDTPLYPGTPPMEFTRLTDVNKGDTYSVTQYTITSHAGTHADAFAHFLAGGTTIDHMPPEHYYGSAVVITVPADALITKKDLEGRIRGAERVVLHSGGKSYLSKEAADYLVSEKVITVVTDAWSVAPQDNETEIHLTLFRAKIAVVENVVLDHVADGAYVLAAFPVKIKDCDGSPVRAVLIA